MTTQEQADKETIQRRINSLSEKEYRESTHNELLCAFKNIFKLYEDKQELTEKINTMKIEIDILKAFIFKGDQQ